MVITNQKTCDIDFSPSTLILPLFNTFLQNTCLKINSHSLCTIYLESDVEKSWHVILLSYSHPSGRRALDSRSKSPASSTSPQPSTTQCIHICILDRQTCRSSTSFSSSSSPAPRAMISKMYVPLIQGVRGNGGVVRQRLYCAAFNYEQLRIVY
jgi:hypothetical protein